MARGRPKGSKNRPKNGEAANGTGPSAAADDAGAPKPGHNAAPADLTDDEKRALLLQHKKRYEATLAAKKEADAALKNTCKRAKAECGPNAVADIKDAIALEAPEGQQLFAAEIERKQRVARWLGLPIGVQTSIFDFTDRTPVDDRAFDAGKQAGMEGANCTPPASCHNPTKWTEGWHAGQAVLLSAFAKTKTQGGDEDASELSDHDKEFEDADPNKTAAMEGGEAAGSYEMAH